MRNQIQTLIYNHLLLRPAMQVEDIYKLLYQSCMGLGHLLSDPESALTRLHSEMIENRDSHTTDLLLEDIAIVHPMVRVNLRPFTDRNLNPEKMVAAMRQTLESFSPSRSGLKAAWTHYTDLEAGQAFPGQRLGIESYDTYIQQADFPVQHHSRLYREKYHPSYRIVDRVVFMNLFSEELKDFHCE